MYLKRIEMKGFKSFADRTIIEFNNHITCVVGPNGSGKSNVADAFRWVLGEQSYKNLRSSNMSDVIFNGTKTRSALGMAEVSIVFDNSEHIFDVDYLEVSITRRLYKSGESEYYINKSPCRLKDIKRLIMDTGIGVEGYSIIAQGRIEQLLSSNNAERRMIFEEAAGIVKYKTSKEESTKKLEKSQINIDRVNDIISEMEHRIGPLKEQSEKAQRYKDLSRELKELEINVFVEDIMRLDMSMAEVDSNIRDLEQKKSQIQEKLSASIAENSKYGAKLKQLDAQIEDLKAEKGGLSRKNDEISQMMRLNLQKIEMTNRQILELKSDVDKAADQRRDIDERLQQQALQTKENLEKLNREYQMIQRHLADKSNLEKQMLENLRTDQAQLSKLKDEIFQLERILNKDRSDLSLLHDYEKNQVGFDKSVKEILKLASEDRAVHGVVRDIIELDEKFEQAIEVALGRGLQNVVVDDRNVATKYIRMLKEQRLGRVSFLPIKEITGRNQVVIKKREGFYGCAVDVLRYEETYENLVSYLLGNVYLVNSLEIANRMYHEFPKSSRIISLDGDLMIIGGAITGGESHSKNHQAGILGRKKKIGRLEILVRDNELHLKNRMSKYQESLKRVEELNQDYHTTKNAFSDLKSKERLSLDMIAMHEKQLVDMDENRRLELEKIQKLSVQKQEKISGYLHEIAVLKKDNESARENMAKHHLQIEDISNQMQNLEFIQQEIRSQIAQEQSQFGKWESEIGSLLAERGKLDIDRVRLETKRENVLQNLWDSYEMGYLDAIAHKVEFNYQHCVSKIKSLKSDIKKLGDVNLASIEEYREQSQRYEFLTSQKADLSESIIKLKSLIKEIDRQMRSDFMESFEKIRLNFKESFQSLFGGGSVDLELREEDVLSSDIIINAQPPGKKLQNLDLMSGGEKSLTAIALLFAILGTSPSPFCILDEIEAALDDVNIFRFSEFLKRYSQKSQFIVITHRRGTMEIADAIYGVTMEEQGISKVLYQAMY